MEPYMNPIYGSILCNKGTIPNNYWLYKDGFINTPMGILIKKVCRDIPGSVQPTKYLMDLEPIDFGRYIALKYINMKTGDKLIQINKSNKIVIDQQLILDVNKIKELTGFINKIRKFIPFLDNDIFTFHIILYCLWWNANNDNGIAEYYEGVKEIFDFLNDLPSIQLLGIKPLVLKDKYTPPIPNSFEETVIKITQKEFKIYSQEKAQHFCTVNTESSTYPDCGEITALNLINLLCFNGSIFDISRLKSSPIPQLEKFYEVFTSFNLMSNINYKPEIFGKHLNARDAWSYLIINYAKNNLEFVKKCTNPIYKFELNAGLNSDKSTSNFLQLIKNLLEINKWEDLLSKDSNITKIEDNTKDGIGDIIIQKSGNNFIIHCRPGHYYMSNEYKKVESLDLLNLTLQQQNIINIIKKTIPPTIENYLDINFSSELLQQTFDDTSSSVELKKKLFVLSLTGKYDSDLRRRIKIDDRILDDRIVYELKNNKNLDEYTYQSNDFKFIERMPYLKHLNSEIKDKTIDKIDLQPLSNLKSIGNNFLSSCKNLSSIINLSSLSKLESIGNNFLSGCSGLTDIDLSSLSNLKSIENDFLNNCSALTSIKLSNLESIGNDFLNGCSGLIDIDLSSLSNLKSIGNNFLSNCSGLTSIDLSPLSNLHSIGDYFLSSCEGLEKIVLSSLSNLHSIGNYFLSRCSTLKSIDLSSLSNLHSIENYFLTSCEGLEKIDLSSLSNLHTIGIRFLSGCSALTSIDLSSLSKLESIGNSFLSSCCRLKSIDLSSLSNLKSIGYGVLSACKIVIKIFCNTIIYNLLNENEQRNIINIDIQENFYKYYSK